MCVCVNFIALEVFLGVSRSGWVQISDILAISTVFQAVDICGSC